MRLLGGTLKTKSFGFYFSSQEIRYNVAKSLES